MSEMNVQGFMLRLDRAYEFADHMWVEVMSPESVRVGMDSLGIETAGTLAQLQFVEEGTVVTRQNPMGSLEAEKFVGPVVAPLSGTVTADDALPQPDFQTWIPSLH
jgi:glycine cleavage system H protein